MSTLPPGNRRLIEKEWQSLASILPADAPPAYRQEMRRAFYAGINCLLSIMENGFSPGEEITDSDESLMDGIAAEMGAFMRDLRQGRA